MEDLKCTICGSLEGKECINPYDEDVLGEENEDVLCDECYHQTCMDIQNVRRLTKIEKKVII